jgi:predicted nucleotidyltransferase
MTLRFGLKEDTTKKICAVFARFPQIEKALLYGSRAKGSYKNGSDIDLTLQGGSELTFDVLLKIMNELDELLLPYTIDLSIFNDISDPEVIEHIQRVAVTFYQRDSGRAKSGEKEKTPNSVSCGETRNA